MDNNIRKVSESKKGCSVVTSSKHTNYSKQGSTKTETNKATTLAGIKKKQSNQ